ncbi:MAG: DUF3127 domain-containing protein [Sphingomonadales bacterium]|jgi:hypothetical protein
MEISGKIFEVMPKVTGTNKSGNPWQKQEFILEVQGGQYPKRALMAIWGDKVDQFQVQKGEDVTVSFDIDCREYNGRWYNDIKAWNIQRKSGTMPASGPSFNETVSESPADVDNMLINNDIATDPSSGGEDLPF